MSRTRRVLSGIRFRQVSDGDSSALPYLSRPCDRLQTWILSTIQSSGDNHSVLGAHMACLHIPRIEMADYGHIRPLLTLLDRHILVFETCSSVGRSQTSIMQPCWLKEELEATIEEVNSSSHLTVLVHSVDTIRRNITSSFSQHAEGRSTEPASTFQQSRTSLPVISPWGAPINIPIASRTDTIS